MDIAQLYQAAQSKIGPRPLRVAGRTICDPAIQTYKDALILQAHLAFDLSPSTSSPDQLLQWIISTYEADLVLLVDGLKRSIDITRSYISDCFDMTYSRFKDETRIPRAGDYFAPVKGFVIDYLETRSPLSMAIVLQWESFITRLTLPFAVADCEEEFVQNDLSVLDHLPEGSDQLREVFQDIVATYHPAAEEYEFRFGNGSNSDSKRKDGLIGKYAAMQNGCNVRQRFLLNKCKWLCPLPVNELQYAEVVTVPKGIDKRRTICEEPAFNMFLQQGIFKVVDEWMSEHLHPFIRLHDASYNTKAAERSSRKLDTATIDLSAASDSVSWVLFKYCAKGSQYYRDVLCTRTECALLPSGAFHTLRKVCPMGSALCFPTECLMFLAIILLSAKQVGRVDPSVLKRIRVYGDDLIVPVEIEDQVLENLDRFGFKVNETKTFLSYDRFKESCGGEYADGVEVTPMRLSRRFRSHLGESSPSHLGNLVDLCNELTIRGWRVTRSCVIRNMILPFYHPYFSDDPRFGIYSRTPTNFHLKERWNTNLQRIEVRAQVVRLEHTGVLGIGDESIRYFECLRRLAVTRRASLLWPDDLIVTEVGPAQPVLAYQWVANNDSVLAGYGVGCVDWSFLT